MHRSFQFNWFKEYEWLEYCQLTDKVVCFYCRFFGGAMANDAWVIPGYYNWKNATAKEKVKNAHNTAVLHVKSAELWAGYHKALKQGSITEKIGNSSEQQKLENQRLIRSVAEVILLCAMQGT